MEVGPRKISVNAVSPGYTQTKLLPDSYHEGSANASLFKRVGQPQDVAHLTTFLASPESAWITGQNIHVNGGVVLV